MADHRRSPKHICLELTLQLLRAYAFERAEDAVPGVVDHNVDRSEAMDSGRDGSDNCRLIVNVELWNHDVVCLLPTRKRSRIACGGGDIPATGSEQFRGRPADAGRATRYENRFSHGLAFLCVRSDHSRRASIKLYAVTHEEHADWRKIRNRDYSQLVGAGRTGRAGARNHATQDRDTQVPKRRLLPRRTRPGS